jgi:hypothetical protein
MPELCVLLSTPPKLQQKIPYLTAAAAHHGINDQQFVRVKKKTV